MPVLWRDDCEESGGWVKESKSVAYECTWRLCKVVIPESDERIQEQIKRHKLPFLRKKGLAITCPECGSSMQRKVFK